MRIVLGYSLKVRKNNGWIAHILKAPDAEVLRINWVLSREREQGCFSDLPRAAHLDTITKDHHICCVLGSFGFSWAYSPPREPHLRDGSDHVGPCPVCEMVLVDDGSPYLVVSRPGLCMKAIEHRPGWVTSKQHFSLAAVWDPAFIALGSGSRTNLSFPKLLSQQHEAQSRNPLLFVSVAVFCSIFFVFLVRAERVTLKMITW